MISTDRKIFEKESTVRARQVEYAKDWAEVHIIVFDKDSSPLAPSFSKRDFRSKEVVVSSNCWAYSTQSRSKFLYPFDAIRLGRFIVQGRRITNITCQDPFLTAMAGVSLKNKFDLPLEIQIHTDIGSPYFTYSFSNKIRKFMATNYIFKADRIRVVSQRIKNYLKDVLKIEDSKIEVRPIAVNTDWIKSAPIIDGADLHKKYPQFSQIVLMASRIEKEKNIALAIQSWKKVVEEIPKTGLIIVGNGSQISNLKSLVSRLSLNENVIFEQWADKNVLVSYYKTADLFLNTSLYEGYGMTLVEAKAAGCEIVSTDVGVAMEVGAKVVGYSPEEVAKKVIEQLL
ncbi:MAG: glycosyltransferase family 4 protein [Patescibacteria group bacterium]